jgi:hypothetical protein
VMFTVGLFYGGDDVEGVSQGGCNGSLNIIQISRYCGLKMIVGHRIFMGK